MTFTFKTAATAIAVTMVLGSGSAAFAKAHDQGVADGFIEFPGGTGAAVQTLDRGVSTVVSGGVRGDASSANGGNNRTVPVEQPGLNEPS